MALQSDRFALGLIALAIVLGALLYAILVMRAPLQWIGFLIPLVGLYLVWRFVRAHERIADALEAGAGTSE